MLLTEVFAPIVLIIALLLIVAVDASADWSQGLVFGGTAAVFVGVLPYGVMLYGIGRGRLGDRHLSERSERPLMMSFGLVSATAGLLTVKGLGAPQDLFALVAAMVAGIAVALSVTVVWKISIHCACVAGAVSVLVVLWGPWALVLAPIALATAWARVHLGDHTVAQTIAGLAVGASVAFVVFQALR
jgi:hypothetical protein